ncbi:MAG: hypothetical protein EBV53_02485 [Proteobacteria bacterium]|nr:hypothetical protein [Pseudomonadota bacterium]
MHELVSRLGTGLRQTRARVSLLVLALVLGTFEARPRRMLAQLMSGPSRRITLAARSRARVSWSGSRTPVSTGPTATFG